MTGLNLNYEPEIVVDISGLTREEWLDYRKKGIGGSDVAVSYTHLTLPTILLV